MKSFLSYLTGAAAAVLLLFALNHFGLFFDSPAGVAIVSRIASPDNVFVATTQQASNARGWCEIRINVDRNGAAFDWEREYVFNTDCGSNTEIKWEGNRNLLIGYSYNKSGEVRTFRQFRSKDKEVSISYVLNQ